MSTIKLAAIAGVQAFASLRKAKRAEDIVGLPDEEVPIEEIPGLIRALVRLAADQGHGAKAVRAALRALAGTDEGEEAP